MSDEKQKKDASGSAALAIASVTAAAEVYEKTKLTPLAVAVGALGVGAVAWDRMKDSLQQRFDRAVASWSAEASDGLPPPGPERDRAVEESADVVIEHTQQLARGVDPAVAPALGRLAAMYVSRGRNPDDFFRGATRWLSDLSAEEFADAQRIFRGVWGTPPSDAHVSLTVAGAPIHVTWGPSKMKQHWKVDIEGPPQSAVRILRSLRLNGLADDGEPGLMDLMIGPGKGTMPRTLAVDLAKILGPSTKTP